MMCKNRTLEGASINKLSSLCLLYSSVSKIILILLTLGRVQENQRLSILIRIQIENLTVARKTVIVMFISQMTLTSPTSQSHQKKINQKTKSKLM